MFKCGTRQDRRTLGNVRSSIVAVGAILAVTFIGIPPIPFWLRSVSVHLRR